MLLGEIKRDGERLEQHETVVDDDRVPPVRVDGEKLRRARAGVADLDGIVLVVEPQLARHPERAEGTGAGDAYIFRPDMSSPRFAGSILDNRCAKTIG